MSLIIYYIFFFLYDLYLSQTTQISFLTNCSNNRYYHSLDYRCKDCSGTKGLNICYANGKSIYTFEDLELPEENCKNSEILLELDGNRKKLQKAYCADPNITVPNITDSNSRSSQGEIKISGESSIVFYYNDTEYRYYNRACLEGFYERACDYAANLCVLSLYNDENPFCGIIKVLNQTIFKIL